MRKWIFIFIPLILVYLSSEAQENVGCNQLLADAKEAYSAGMVEIVPELNALVGNNGKRLAKTDLSPEIANVAPDCREVAFAKYCEGLGL